MQLAELLNRDGLTKNVRITIGIAVCTWHADWQRFTTWCELLQREARPRADAEETLLQCVLFCGFPRVITAFEQLASAWPSNQPPSGGSLPVAEQSPAGGTLFDTIYGKNQQAVRSMLKSYHHELHDFVLEAAYGRILTRPHLSALHRELIAVAVLAAQGQKRQFAGHARGARHLGANREQLREALVTTFGAADEHATAVDSWLSLVR